MIHIADNIYLDVDASCFILQEEVTTPEFRIIKGEKVPNKGAGEKYFDNLTFHATHKEVVNKLISIGLYKALTGEAKQFFDYMEQVESKFEEILKLKRC